MRSDVDRLHDILDAIVAIQENASTRQRFDEDKMVRVWCLHPRCRLYRASREGNERGVRRGGRSPITGPWIVDL
jgi:hypothetical protein